MKELSLPSGRKLKIQLAPFAESKALYQAVLEECKSLKIDKDADLDVNLFKDLFCSSFSSPKIEAALNKCLARCIYDGERLTDLDKAFEPEEARQDFLPVCYEVAMENIGPFVKSLFARFSQVAEMLKASPPA